MTIMHLGKLILNEIDTSFSLLDEQSIQNLFSEIQKAPKIFFIGAGRSKLVLSAFCMRLNHLGKTAYVAGNIPCPPASKGDLIIAATGSGETPSVISVLEKVRSTGVSAVVITACASKVPSHVADHIITIKAPDTLIHKAETKTYQMMRTLFEQTVFLLAEAIVLKIGEEIPREEIASRHTNLE